MCWVLLRNPQLKILVISASKIRADDFTTFTRRLINEMPMLQHLRPKDGQRDSKVAFDVGPAGAAHAPSVKSVGITGQIAGSRADLIVPDDIEVPNNSATQMMRDKLSEAVKEFDAVVKPGGKIAYLGTPQLEQSLYNELQLRGYSCYIIPARVPDAKQMEAYGDRLAPYIHQLVDRGVPAGTPTDPKRFSSKDLDEREASYGRSGFQLQFMLDTRLSDANRYPLKVSDLMVMDLDPRMGPTSLMWGRSSEKIINDIPNVAMQGDRFYAPAMCDTTKVAPYEGAVMFIDPAGKGTDEVGYAVVKFLHGNLFVTAAGGLQGGFEDTVLEHLAKVARDQQVHLIKIEENFGQGMFSKLLRPWLTKVGHPCTIEDVRSSQQKERRICDTLEPVMNQHRLIFDRKVLEQDYRSTENLIPENQMRYRLVYQLTRVTREKGALPKDDRLDALASAVAHWTEIMGQDQREAVEAHEEALKAKQLEDFMDRVLNREPGGAGWLNGYAPISQKGTRPRPRWDSWDVEE